MLCDHGHQHCIAASNDSLGRASPNPAMDAFNASSRLVRDERFCSRLRTNPYGRGAQIIYRPAFVIVPFVA